MANGTEVTGTAEPGSEVEVTVGGQVYTVTASDPDGDWTVTPTAPDTFDESEAISVEATDSNGNTSDPTTSTFDATAPAAPVIEMANGTEVTGTAEPGSEVEVTVGGQVYTVTASEPDGDWTVSPTAPDTFDNAEGVSVTATDSDSNVSDPATDMIDTVAPMPTVNTLVTGLETTIHGTGEPGVEIEVFDDSSNSLGTAIVDANGDYSITPSTPLAEGAQVEARQTDADGNTGTSGLVITAHDTDADTVANTIDVDDDGDGILDIDESGSVIPLDFSSLSNNTALGTYSLGTLNVQGLDIDVNATIVDDVMDNNNQWGDANGNLVIGDADSGDEPDATTGDEIELDFSSPTKLIFNNETGAGEFKAPAALGGDEIRLQAKIRTDFFLITSAIHEMTLLTPWSFCISMANQYLQFGIVDTAGQYQFRI